MNRDATIDVAALLATVDLVDLVAGDTGLHKVGRELHGPCPFCVCQTSERGRHLCDRFRVDPTEQRWYCRRCSPKGGDAIAYLRQRDGLDFREACRALGVLPTGTAGKSGINRSGGSDRGALSRKSAGKSGINVSEPDESPPPAAWQARAAEYIAQAEAALWTTNGARALAYLHDVRGLTDATIRRWRLGYQPTNDKEPPSRWGLDDEQAVRLPRGIVIPWLHDREPWAVKIRRPLLPGDDSNRYHHVRGSLCHVLFGASTVVSHRPATLMEAELDVLLLDQEAGDLTGSATANATRTDFTCRQLWVLRKAAPIYVGYDNDKRGREAMQAVVAIGPRFRPVTWPDGVKDLADAWKAGHDVRAWVQAQLSLEVVRCGYCGAPTDPLTEYGRSGWCDACGEQLRPGDEP